MSVTSFSQGDLLIHYKAFFLPFWLKDNLKKNFKVRTRIKIVRMSSYSWLPNNPCSLATKWGLSMVSCSQLQVAKLAQMCPAVPSSAQQCPAASSGTQGQNPGVKTWVKTRVAQQHPTASNGANQCFFRAHHPFYILFKNSFKFRFHANCMKVEKALNPHQTGI